MDPKVKGDSVASSLTRCPNRKPHPSEDLFPHYSKEHLYYVYFHKDLDGVVNYIGMGKGKRAWSKARKPDHKEWINSLEHDYVEIQEAGLTQLEAFQLESRHILSGEYSPRFNNILRAT